MEKHIVVKTTCKCGTVVGLTNIQFNDMDCGMMGFFNCPQCKEVMFPSSHRKVEMKEERNEVEGKDPGWC